MAFNAQDNSLDPLIGNFLMRIQQILIILKVDRQDNGLTNKKKRWLLLFDFSIAAILTASIACLVFTCVNVKTCPTDFNKFRAYRGQCYRLSNRRGTWSEAHSDCKARNGYLLEMYSFGEQTYLYEGIRYANEDGKITLWIGASDHSLSGQFLWNKTNLQPQVANWASGFPSKKTSPTTCVMLLNEMRFPWINVECIEESHYICKMELFETPRMDLAVVQDDPIVDDVIDDVPGAIELIPWASQIFQGSSRVVLFRQDVRLSWDDARLVCQNYSMDLVSLDSEAKWLFLEAQLTNRRTWYMYTPYSFWLGAERPANASNSDRLIWTNGQNFTNVSFFEERLLRDASLTKQSRFCLAFKKFIGFLSCESSSELEKSVVCEKYQWKHKCLNDHDCNQRATCSNGSCYCQSGFAGNGRYCFDVNECLSTSVIENPEEWERDDFFTSPGKIKTHDCRNFQSCRNKIGWHDCIADADGFQ